jgi:SSS family solute:Na+ symporter
MSTADSCIIASSGNFVNDLLERRLRDRSHKRIIRFSQLATLAVGIVAIVLASYFSTVLEAILYAYQFMVAGLFVPTLAAYFWPGATKMGALGAMIGGGSLALILILSRVNLPWGLDPTIFGMLLSALLLVSISLLAPEGEKQHA